MDRISFMEGTKRYSSPFHLIVSSRKIAMITKP